MDKVSVQIGIFYRQVLRRHKSYLQEDDGGLAHKHEGYYGALAPQNLKKPRKKAPFDVTGAWFIDLHEGFDKFMYGPPYPEFYEPGQKANGA